MADDRARFLGTGVKITLLVGLLIAAIPFAGSLRPSQNADELNHFERIDVANFDRNSSRVVDISPPKRWEEGDTTLVQPGRAWLVIRDNAGVFRVFGLPTWDGDILIGLKYWGQFEGYCHDLGPVSGTSIIDAETEIQCNDEDNDSYFFAHWRWTLEGKNISRVVVDMELVRSELQQDDLVIFDPVWNLD